MLWIVAKIPLDGVKNKWCYHLIIINNEVKSGHIKIACGPCCLFQFHQHHRRRHCFDIVANDVDLDVIIIAIFLWIKKQQTLFYSKIITKIIQQQQHIIVTVSKLKREDTFLIKPPPPPPPSLLFFLRVVIFLQQTNKIIPLGSEANRWPAGVLDRTVFI